MSQDNQFRERILDQLTERPSVDWRLFAQNNNIPLPDQQVQDDNHVRERVLHELTERPAVDWRIFPPPSPSAPPPPLPPPLPSAPPASVRFPRPFADNSQGLGFAPGMRRRRQAPASPMMTVINFDGARQQSDMSLAARFHGYMPEEKQRVQVQQQPLVRTRVPPLLSQLEDDRRIATFPTRKIVNLAQENTADCVICYESWQCDQEVRTLPCLHYFHVACIDRWLHQNMTCPQCRHRL